MGVLGGPDLCHLGSSLAPRAAPKKRPESEAALGAFPGSFSLAQACWNLWPEVRIRRLQLIGFPVLGRCPKPLLPPGRLVLGSCICVLFSLLFVSGWHLFHAVLKRSSQ